MMVTGDELSDVTVPRLFLMGRTAEEACREGCATEVRAKAEASPVVGVEICIFHVAGSISRAAMSETGQHTERP